MLIKKIGKDQDHTVLRAKKNGIGTYTWDANKIKNVVHYK